MGLLDDAIREHLELKRRRGANPTEVDRLEREALGPVRRGTQVSDEPFLEEESFEGGETMLYDDEAEEEYAESAELAPEPHVREEAHESLRERESEQHWSRGPAEEWEAEEPPAAEDPSAPAAEAPPPPPRAAGAPPAAEPVEEGAVHPGEETIEYDVEAEEAKGDKREDDVLEETPEFLQDTPDHDRLWFEQKPPRDFDFDK